MWCYNHKVLGFNLIHSCEPREQTVCNLWVGHIAYLSIILSFTLPPCQSGLLCGNWHRRNLSQANPTVNQILTNKLYTEQCTANMANMLVLFPEYNSIGRNVTQKCRQNRNTHTAYVKHCVRNLASQTLARYDTM